MDEPACAGCRALLQRTAELEAKNVALAAQVAELTRRLDEALRAGKRQAAPFRKGPPKPDSKTPGRKPGDAHGTHGHRPEPPPEQVTECHEARLPDAWAGKAGHGVPFGSGPSAADPHQQPSLCEPHPASHGKTGKTMINKVIELGDLLSIDFQFLGIGIVSRHIGNSFNSSIVQPDRPQIEVTK